MQIVSVSVEHFGRIEKAVVPLCPGLNILFGPNDLGKSTLGQAIRFALLLQDSSSAHEQVVGWASDLPPRVELVLKTEAQRFWRITKSFDSSRGSSLLEESRDGESFAQVCKGRRVDEEIRKLLAWGIPPPGGRGGPRGMPESFLATALLGQQGDVDAILMSSIGEDPDDSGKQQITRALQALAQHPMFTKVFGKTQAKVDEAFTSGGQLKRGKNDPFPQVQRRVQEFQAEYEGQQRKVDETRQVADRIREIERKRVAKQAECDALAGRLAELEKDLANAEALRNAEERCAQMRQQLGQIDEVVGFVSSLQARKAQGETELQEKLARLAELTQHLHVAAEDLSAARERWRDVSGGMEAQAALARKNDLERQQIELDAREREASSALRQAHEAGEKEARLAQLDGELDRKRKELAALTRRLSELQGAEDQAVQDQKHIRGLAVLARRREASTALQKAEENDAAARRLGAEANAKRTEAERIEAELAAKKLPSSEQMDTLRRLQKDLSAEEVKLGVGLSIEIRSHRPLSIEVARDGNPVEQHSFSEAAAFEADRELRMTIASVGDVVVTGGTRTTREKVRKLRARWKKEGALVFSAAGARDMGELEDICRAASLQAENARAMRKEADGLLQQQRALGDVAAALDESRQRLSECDQELSGLDPNQLEQRAALFGDRLGREIRRLEREAQEKLDAARAKREECKLAVAEATPRVENIEKDQQRTRADLDKALSGIKDGGWQVLVAQAEQSLAGAREKRAEIVERLQQEGQALTQSLAAAERRIQEADTAHAAARHASEHEQREIDELRQSLATLRGQLEERSRAAAAVDRPAAERALAEAQAALAAHPSPRSHPTEADRTKAQEDLEIARIGLRDLEGELHKTQGALEQVGGHVAEEELEQIKQALEQAEEQHRETDKEYRAWKLLLDTLQKAENEQASHLGKTLVDPVASRFLSLTRARYEGVRLGTDLETQGVAAAGGIRDTKALSVGTREQLATIFRLSLAERLQCSLLLDDQLVQSDSARMAWFSQLMRNAATSIQMIVLTCRPEDYLEAEEIPPPNGPVFLDNPIGPVRALDLGRIIVG